MHCTVHYKEQLVLLDGTLFFSSVPYDCENACIKDPTCTTFTFSGKTCQTFSGKVSTMRPYKVCPKPNCMWGVCRAAT